MNKVIFLDIDGVLNLFGDSYKTNSVAFDTHFQEIITRMEFHLVKRLEYIIKDNNIADYIVLDDEIDIPKALNLAPKEDRNSWVGTIINPAEGLTNEAATYAVKVLNRTLPTVY